MKALRFTTAEFCPSSDASKAFAKKACESNAVRGDNCEATLNTFGAIHASKKFTVDAAFNAFSGLKRRQ